MNRSVRIILGSLYVGALAGVGVSIAVLSHWAAGLLAMALLFWFDLRRFGD